MKGWIIRTNFFQLLLMLIIIAATGYYLKGEYLQSLERDVRYKEFTVLYPDSEISSVVLQGDYIWAGGKDGIIKIDSKTQDVAYESKDQPQIKYVRALLVDHKGLLWVGHDNGLSIYNGATWSHITAYEGLCDNRVYSLAEDLQHKIWVGTWHGVSVLENSRFVESLTVEDGLIDNMVNAILPDQQGNIWFGSYLNTAGGISLLGPSGNWTYFTTGNGLLHSYVTSLSQDAAGNVWVGTGLLDQGGVSIFNWVDGKLNLVHQLTKGDGLAGEKVRSSFMGDHQLIWLGSEYDGVTLYRYKDQDLKGGQVQAIYTTAHGLSNNEVKSMTRDNEGNMWLGTKSGVTRIAYEFLRQYEQSESQKEVFQ